MLLLGCALIAARPATASPLAEDEARGAMASLADAGPEEAQALLAWIVAAQDERFVAVLLELLWARQVGLEVGPTEARLAAALGALSGQRHGTDWRAWAEWYGATALEPPPGFMAWKGGLLARIDPALGDFLREGAPVRLRPEEIQWGGVPVDGIPALDGPRMVAPAKATYLQPEEAVFGIALGGEARAYPLRFMDWHEMANDEVGGVPVALAYCTLCGAGIAWHGQVADGRTLTFGTSGLLYRSNKLMYDRQTRTLWNQLTGEPVLGPLAGTDVRLEPLPVVLTSWQAWHARHPESLVMAFDTGHDRIYVPGLPYGSYFRAPDTMFPVWQRSDKLPTKARVFALRIRGVPKAYPLEALRRERVVNDTLAGAAVVLIAAAEDVRVSLRTRSGESVDYSAGGEVRAYAREGETFRPGAEPGTVLDDRGRLWRVTAEALEGPGGRRLARLPGHLAYWFGWYAFFPKTELYEGAE